MNFLTSNERYNLEQPKAEISATLIEPCLRELFVILLVTCAEITIVLCYFQLCSEDYLWWWRSYLTSGSSAVYLFMYATFYFFTKLDITKLVSSALYFGYMLIASYAFSVLTGTIGFYACFIFTRLIYSSVKID
ncbi:PREDICTED: transmembrane 9 superfamily member 8-like [Erythranthe guttata]|uniref:transmembrane 9 superfamily member 8-like n=1 Tax=Erythranthe guttata TaxID=4155 RepID=UPI00064DF827|nr:PREDICTED: transmembrane 9 superfamily member 8-like [Erythranthe guttata]|eukprot:XP_012836568.1 PREDICTED: transmembrane 9 superfamily member 8-like [Erythranthe guttata]